MVPQILRSLIPPCANIVVASPEFNILKKNKKDTHLFSVERFIRAIFCPPFFFLRLMGVLFCSHKYFCWEDGFNISFSAEKWVSYFLDCLLLPWISAFANAKMTVGWSFGHSGSLSTLRFPDVYPECSHIKVLWKSDGTLLPNYCLFEDDEFI